MQTNWSQIQVDKRTYTYVYNVLHTDGVDSYFYILCMLCLTDVYYAMRCVLWLPFLILNSLYNSNQRGYFISGSQRIYIILYKII